MLYPSEGRVAEAKYLIAHSLYIPKKTKLFWQTTNKSSNSLILLYIYNFM